MIGLAGFSGQLVTPSYLSKRVQIESGDFSGLRRAAFAAHRLARQQLGPASSVRTILEVGLLPLAAALGFDRPIDQRAGVSCAALALRAGRSPVAFLVIPWGDRFDGWWRTAVTEAIRRGATWCVIFNGLQLRVVDARCLYSRRHIDCDVTLAVDDDVSFAALMSVASASALGANATDSQSLHALVAESDRDAAGVCRSLRDGVLDASQDVLRALVARDVRRSDERLHDSFDQSLTIVYRIVFLLFAEARALVPIWHPVYRESYTIDSLRTAAERSRNPRGLWDALRAMARLAHAGCRLGDLQVTPFNGRLFAPARTPLAERRDLDDNAASRAILALSTRPAPDRACRERIEYRELGVEQLGAVYETLLDYRPRATSQSGLRSSRPDVTLEAGSGLRKATGTFYTPQPIADYVVRRTLAPLVRNATPDAILGLRIVDLAMGSGAFLVAACRYLAAAYEQALIEAGSCHASDVTEADRTAIRRLIAERCLYGVDLNPMAVQLARLSLWLTTLAADRPLSFLDHRLLTGDSLLGVWLHQLRQPPHLRGRPAARSLPLFPDDATTAALASALPIRYTLESTPNDSVDQVRAKERALAELNARGSALARWKRVADLWCAMWFTDAATIAPEAYGALADEIVSASRVLPAGLSAEYQDRANALAAGRRFFHWELEFPEAFFDADGRQRANGGFDAVIGNPPWEMLRADAGDAADRSRQRLSVASTVRFTRDSGVYGAQSNGHANQYQLFVERAIALTRAGGRLGLVLPSGLAADHGSAALRRHLLSRCDVDALVGIDNHRAIFPIHRGVRFLLLTATAGRATGGIACRFGLDAIQDLETIGENDETAFPISLTPAAIEALSGTTLAIPHLRDATDLRISEKAAQLFKPVGDADGWAARFGRELNATDDRGAFRSRGRGWPVVDGKHIEPFTIAADQARRAISAADARRLLSAERVERPRLAYRDVASATNRLTLIAAVLPARTVSTHTIFCLRTSLPLRDQHTLCGFFNSFVVNYLVRLRVTTHVTTVIVQRLPVPTRRDAPAACREIGALARLLARRRDPDAFARLNACVARLYQLTPEEFRHVLGTFPLIAAAEREAALAEFGRLR